TNGAEVARFSNGAIYPSGGLILREAATAGLSIYGGNADTNGAGVRLYGGSHATLANTGRLTVGATAVASWTTGTLSVTPSTAATSASTGALVVTGGLGVGGATYLGGALTGLTAALTSPAAAT